MGCLYMEILLYHNCMDTLKYDQIFLTTDLTRVFSVNFLIFKSQYKITTVTYDECTLIRRPTTYRIIFCPGEFVTTDTKEIIQDNKHKGVHGTVGSASDL